MIEAVSWLKDFIMHYSFFEYLIIFLGSGFGGDFVILAFGFLAAQNVISIYSVIFFSFLGTFFSDILWFLLGKTSFVKKIILHRHANNTIGAINEALNRISKGNHYIAFIIAKFLVGTRVLLIMYVSTTNINFKKFMTYDLVSIFVWLLIVIPIGFLSGLGFIYFAKILENLYAGIGFILLIIILIMILEIWVKKIFTKKN